MTEKSKKSKLSRFFSPRKILSVLTFILVVYILYQNRADFVTAFDHLKETNIFVLLLLLPEQLFMYYCCGQIFFSYLHARRKGKGISKKVSPWELTRISFELNFVNHAVPAGGIGGLGYITWRLKPYGSTPGQTSFMYLLRYIITCIANQVQTLLAVAVLLLFKTVPPSALWLVYFVAGLSVAIIIVLAILIVIASSKKRLLWVAKLITRIANGAVKILTFGKKRAVLSLRTVEKYFLDLHADLEIAKNNKKILKGPIIWGFIYSFFEIATYWVTSISLGYPNLFPEIMVGEAIGSVFGAIVPYGLYELGMAGVMSTLGVETSLAALIVVMTRVVVMSTTILSGYGFYQHAISKLNRREKSEIIRENQ